MGSTTMQHLEVPLNQAAEVSGQGHSTNTLI